MIEGSRKILHFIPPRGYCFPFHASYLASRHSMTPLQSILATYRATSQSEREKGSYFEELIRTNFRYEATYAEDYRVRKADIDSFFTEWTQESATPLHSFAVCSDIEVGKKRNKDEDIVETFAHELRYPATTDAKRLAVEMEKRHDAHHMSVVFSTYHSLDVISRAQHLHCLGGFDLTICDEARKTGRRSRPRLQAVRDATRISMANQRDPRWNVGTLKRVPAQKTYRTF